MEEVNSVLNRPRLDARNAHSMGTLVHWNLWKPKLVDWNNNELEFIVDGFGGVLPEGAAGEFYNSRLGR